MSDTTPISAPLHELAKKTPGKPWLRFAARTLDGQLFTLPFLVPITRFTHWLGSHAGSHAALCTVLPTVLLMMFLTFSGEALCLSKLQTTPGKALHGIMVRTKEGAPITLRQALRRCWGVLLHGYSLWIPPLYIFSLLREASKIRKGDDATWDEELGLVVLYKPVSAWRRWSVPIFFAMYFSTLLIMAGMHFQQRSSRQKVPAPAAASTP